MAVLADEPTPGLDEFKAKIQKVTDWYRDNKDILIKAAEENKEMVNHPDHYQGSGGMEVIDIIENYDLGFSLGNAIKYILRSNKKGSAKQDLKKAIWYINREISNLVEEEDCEDV